MKKKKIFNFQEKIFKNEFESNEDLPWIKVL